MLLIMSFYTDMMAMVKDLPTAKLANEAGVSEGQIAQAMQTLGPVVLGQLARKKKSMSPEELDEFIAGTGASEDVESILNRQAEDGVAVNPDLTANGLFDSSTGDQAASAISQRAGISGTVARKLIPMLVPMILGMLMKKGKEDADTPSRASGLWAILDRDGDGKVIDDIFSMATGGSGGGGKGLLGKILGMFFGRK